MKNTSSSKYGSVSQALHWLTAILVLVAFVFGPGGPEQRVYSAGMDFERHLHETLGVAVFGLTLLRLLWKLVDTPPQPVALARWMHISSKAVQGFLYLLLLAVPLTAIAGAWLEGHEDVHQTLTWLDVSGLSGQSSITKSPRATPRLWGPTTIERLIMTGLVHVGMRFNEQRSG